jgi:hypothetical protein
MENINLKILKDYILHTYETYTNMKQKGYFDVSILLHMYEISALCLQDTNDNFIVNIDLVKNIRKDVHTFWYSAIRTPRINTDILGKMKKVIDNRIYNKYINEMIEMERTIKEFLHLDYNFSEEELIRDQRLVIDKDKGVFAIDANYFE